MMKELYFLHVITISDGYAMCDCIPFQEAMASSDKTIKDILQTIHAFVLMIKSEKMIKHETYKVELELNKSFHDGFVKSCMPMLAKNTAAYTFIENTLNIYYYDNLETLAYKGKLLDTAACRIPGSTLENNFLSASNSLSHEFTIYNAGAALCTAILNHEGKPYFVYDMGCTITDLKGNHGKNFTMDIMHVEWICISHRHFDHFNYFLRFANLLSNANLIINDNFLGNHSIVIRQILYAHSLNHTLHYLKKDVVHQFSNSEIKLFSKIQDKQTNKQVLSAHENNIGMLIHGDKNILLTGDNVYDSFDPELFNNIQVLCATHHGGKYWNRDRYFLPVNKANGILVVSTSGQHYGHPSELDAYRRNGWTNIYITYNGDVRFTF